MKITSKGQVTIPQAVREKAGLHPHSEVEFEVRDNGEVILRAVTAPATTARAAFARVRGSANSKAISPDIPVRFPMARGSSGQLAMMISDVSFGVGATNSR